MGRNRDKKIEIQRRREQRKNDKNAKKSLRDKLSRMKGDRFKLSKQYLEFATNFEKEIAPLQVRTVDVVGDGNCLFRSLADQIDGNETTHKFLRQQACNYLRKNREFFQPFLDQDQDGSLDKYLKLMEKDGEWGGHLELQALCQCFKCLIVVHKRQMQEFVMRPMLEEQGPLKGGILHLGYYQHQDFEHYVSIRAKDDFSERPAVQGLKFLNNNMYKHMLYQDEDEYLIQKQMEQMQIIEKLQNQFNSGQQNGQNYNEYENEIPEPFPNYPRNKKCKCGSKIPYKDCCFKEYQKEREKKFYK